MNLRRIHKGQHSRWPLLSMAVLMAFWAKPIPAQTPSPQAAQLAAAVDSHYDALRSLRVHFAETYRGLGAERTESGDLLLRKPGRMRWTYSDPAGKVFVVDGGWAWFYSPGDAQVQRIPAKELNDLRSPLRFLLGHTRIEKELGDLTAAPAEGGLFTLRGVPSGAKQRIQFLSLAVDAAGTIHSMTIEEVGGARTRFTFTDERPNAPAPAADFRFEPPAGLPVVNGLPPI
jgi:outer membrane lipoprotein carrier protein